MQTNVDVQKAPSAVRLVIVGMLTAVVLLRFAPDWTVLITGLGDPWRWVEAAGADTVSATIAQALLWLAACWLGLGVLLAGLAFVPGHLGRVADLVSRRTQPKLLQRIILAAAGASIVWSPITASAGPAPAAPSSSIVVTLPTDTGKTAGPSIYPTQSTSTPAQSTPAPSTPAQPTPAQPTPARLAPTASTPDGSAQVRVEPDDSLWHITADRLGSQATASKIAAAWPQLYAANRQVIGEDPGLLRPGQTLVVPASIEAQA